MAACGWVNASAQSLYSLPPGVETRWASPENPLGEKSKGAQANGGRKGAAAVSIKANQQITLAEVHGTSGTVRRIWATMNDRSPEMVRGLTLQMFWDGSAQPAVSAPFGDFFGFGLGQMVPFQSALFSSPEGKSFNCYIPMPFRTGMKIVVINESGKDLPAFFYDVDYTLGDKREPTDLYFHARFRHESPTNLQEDFEILPEVLGSGRFLGVQLSVVANRQAYLNKWWGEGEVKFYLDQDRQWPTLVGTGTEDYVGAGFTLGVFSSLYQGAPFVDKEKGCYSFYRYHVPDPIYFRTRIRVTVQQIGIKFRSDGEDPLFHTGSPLYKAGAGLVPFDKEPVGWYALFERQDDWSSVAYFYLNRPGEAVQP